MTDHDEVLKISSFSFGGIFKVIFYSGLLIWILFASIWVFLAFIAPESLKINGAAAENTMAALKGVPLVLLIGVGFSIFGAALGAGLLRVFGRILPLGKLN